MKKLILICGIAAYANPAIAVCTIKSTSSAECNKETLSCSNGKCTQTYTYTAAGDKVCECTQPCSEETFPAGWDALTCYCPQVGQ